jgi:hypothetical protein
LADKGLDLGEGVVRAARDCTNGCEGLDDSGEFHV